MVALEQSFGWISFIECWRRGCWLRNLLGWQVCEPSAKGVRFTSRLNPPIVPQRRLRPFWDRWCGANQRGSVGTSKIRREVIDFQGFPRISALLWQSITLRACS